MKKMKLFITVLALFSICSNVLFAQTFSMPSIQSQEARSMERFMPSAIDFDSNNNPYMFNERYPDLFGTIQRFNHSDSSWDTLSFRDELISFLSENIDCNGCAKEDFLPINPEYQSNGMISINPDNLMMMVVFPKDPNKDQDKKFPVIVYSENVSLPNPKFEFHHFYNIKSSDKADVLIESKRGFNEMNNWLPMVGLWERTGKKLHESLNFSHPNTLTVFFPDTSDGFSLKQSLILSDSALHRSTHSGGRSWVVTKGNYSYIIYARLFPDDFKPNRLDLGETSMSLAIVDRTTNKILEGSNHFFARAHKPTSKSNNFPDGHCIPEIGLDENGNFHIIIGSHSGDLKYYHSKEDSTSNPIKEFVFSDQFGEKSDKNGSSYPSLIIAKDNSPLVSYRRRWLESALVIAKGKAISADDNSKHFSGEEFLVIEPDEEIIHYDKNPNDYYYTNWNHRLFVDNNGRIFNLNTLRRRDNECPAGNNSCEQNYPWILLYSDDSGDSWNMLDDFRNLKTK